MRMYFEVEGTCGEDWQSKSAFPVCFKFNKQKKTWLEAQRSCFTEMSNLMTTTNQDEYDFIVGRIWNIFTFSSVGRHLYLLISIIRYRDIIQTHTAITARWTFRGSESSTLQQRAPISPLSTKKCCGRLRKWPILDLVIENCTLSTSLGFSVHNGASTYLVYL